MLSNRKTVIYKNEIGWSKKIVQRTGMHVLHMETLHPSPHTTVRQSASIGALEHHWGDSGQP